LSGTAKGGLNDHLACPLVHAWSYAVAGIEESRFAYSGKVGDQVAIMGSGLTGAVQVTFGGIKATIFTVNSGSQVASTVPIGAKTGKIAIKTAGGIATSSATFTVLQ
jgi:IPT/TIG domain